MAGYGFDARAAATAAWLAAAAALGAGAAAAQTPTPDPALRRAAAAAPVPVLVALHLPEAPAIARLPDGRARDRAQAEAVRAAQEGLIGRVLAARGGAASTGLRAAVYSPVVALTADAALLDRLAADPGVAGIWRDPVLAPALSASTARIGVPALLAEGIDGSGWRIAVLDTGVQADHAFLSGQVVAEACLSSTDPGAGTASLCPSGADSQFGPGAAADCDRAWLRGCGHGTHVAGVAAGRHSQPRPGQPAHGTAPGAGIIAMNVFAQYPRRLCETYGLPPLDGQEGCVLVQGIDLLRGLEQVWAMRHDHRIAAVNLSLGGSLHASAAECDALIPPFTEAMDRLVAAGIAVVAAAGNNGRDGVAAWPACISSVVAVGNTGADDRRHGSSNWGALIDLAAPGVAIQSSVVSRPGGSDFGWLSGTSMAAPHVAGAVALLRAARPGADLPAILAALRETGRPVEAAGVRRPRIDVAAAHERLTGGRAATETRLEGPAQGTAWQPVELVARVAAERGAPAGRVSFRRDGAELTAAELADGVARTTLHGLGPGSHRLTAHFLPGPGFRPSDSAPLDLQLHPRPANDDFAARAALVPGESVRATTAGATPEAAEPAPLAPDHATSIWWHLTPDRPGRLQVAATGEGIGTVLSVYAGDRLGALSLLASDLGGRPESEVAVAVAAGAPLAIAVAGWRGAMGAVTLRATLAADHDPESPRPTTTRLILPTAAAADTPLDLAAEVRVPGDPPRAATGRVRFLVDDREVATAPLDAAGTARVGGLRLAAGSRRIRAEYAGAEGLAPSASPEAVLTLVAPEAGVLRFRGGGALAELGPACGPLAGRAAEPVRLRLLVGPGPNGREAHLALAWRTGSEVLTLPPDLDPAASWMRALGRQIRGAFATHPIRPSVRVLQRQIVGAPAGAGLAAAGGVVLRLGLRNFAGLSGCTALLGGTLARAD